MLLVPPSAERPVPLRDGAAVAVRIGGIKLHGCIQQGIGGTGREGCNGGQLHRADVNQPVLRARIAALVGAEGVAQPRRPHQWRAEPGNGGMVCVGPP